MESETFVSAFTFGRATRRQLKKYSDGRAAMVQELYTIAELVKLATGKRGHRTGDSLSIETGWDFFSPERRATPLQKIKEEKPYMVILAFPCAPWSGAQASSEARGCLRLLRDRLEHTVLVKFAVGVAKLQLASGRHFIIENPASARSWRLVRRLVELMNTEGLYVVNFPQCALGAEAKDGSFIRKGTRFLTSSAKVSEKSSGFKCDRIHEHKWLPGADAARAAVYPSKMCDAIVERSIGINGWTIRPLRCSAWGIPG